MAELWYYVRNGERLGPVQNNELSELIQTQELKPTDFIWTKGFKDWMKIAQVDEFKHLLEVAKPLSLEFKKLPENEKLIWIRTGMDRNGAAVDYGPFDKSTILKLFQEQRINGKTLIYTKQLTSWMPLADISDFEHFFNQMPPVIEDADRRTSLRKPIVARLFIANKNQVFEGICRDVSIGGMQVLIADYPGGTGDRISINVHPDNTDYCFVADGVIVRMLEGNHGFSFRFDVLNEEAKSAIQKYINLN